VSKKVHHFIEKDFDKVALFAIIMLLVVAILLKYGNALFG
jgi:hypothetical protein